MKKTLIIIILSFVFLTTKAFSLSEKQLDKLAGKANTEVGYNYIWSSCEDEDAFLEIMYGRECKCAIKMGKAGNEISAYKVWNKCID